MNGAPWKIAVEGPCCAGKTTLIDALVEQLTDLRVRRVPCYADHVGGGRFLPREVPETLTEDATGLEALIGLDEARMGTVVAGQVDVILLDRSAHTFLAHRKGIENVTGLACFAPAQRALCSSSRVTWPDLVFYLDVPHAAVRARNRGKFPDNSMLIDSGFNTGARSYFLDLATARPSLVSWLDAAADPDLVAAEAENTLLDFMAGGIG